MATVPSWAGQPCHAATSPVSIFGHAITFETHAANAIHRAVLLAIKNAPKRSKKVHSVGACNCRQTTGGHSWSAHSWCGAVDLDPTQNPFTSSGKLITDFPSEFVDAFKHEGFGWGGDWHSVKDAMHFSIATNEGGHITPQTYDPALRIACEKAWKTLTGSPTPIPPPPPIHPGKPAPPFVAVFELERPAPFGEHIKVWQTRMSTRGWTIDKDGYYGEKSRTVCQAFQREMGLQPDGIVGRITWTASWEKPIL